MIVALPSGWRHRPDTAWWVASTQLGPRRSAFRVTSFWASFIPALYYPTWGRALGNLLLLPTLIISDMLRISPFDFTLFVTLNFLFYAIFVKGLLHHNFNCSSEMLVMSSVVILGTKSHLQEELLSSLQHGVGRLQTFLCSPCSCVQFVFRVQ